MSGSLSQSRCKRPPPRLSERRLTRFAAVTAWALLLSLPVTACEKEDKAEVERKLDELEEEAERAWEKAEPEIKEGVREAGEAVGKGVEAAGEAIQKGGQELQDEFRDTTASTLPDTVTKEP